MRFTAQLSQLRNARGFNEQALAEAAGLHVNQIKRYEAGSAQPTLEVMKKPAVALSSSADALLFDEAESGPDDALKLQFEAVRQFDADDRRTALEVLEGLILKHQAKRMIARTQSQPAATSNAKPPARARSARVGG